MPPSGEGALIGPEKLPAPDLPVGAEARAVHRQADHLPGEAVFRQDAHDMGVVVLDGDTSRPAIRRAARLA